MSSFIDVDSVLLEVDDLLAANKIVEGRDVLLNILEEYPDSGKAHNYLGWIYNYKIIDFKKAEEHYKLALKFDKDYPPSYVNYAYFLIEIGDFKEMISFAKEALKNKYSDKGIIYNQLAKAQELRDELKLAYTNYLLARKHTLANNYMEEINSSLLRVKSKMSFFERLSVINKN